MAIELSNLTFTDEGDIFFASGVEQILNREVGNTLAVDDLITGTSDDYGFENVSVLSSDDGNDTITGIESLQPEFGSSYGIVNSGAWNADESNDILTGTASRRPYPGFSGLTIHSIKCIKANGDPTGPDDTYIKVNGEKIWGDYNMNNGRTRSVDRSVDAVPGSAPWVELFDDDHGWSRDDWMGGFTAVSTHGFQKMQLVEGGGSIYEVYYSLGASYLPWTGGYTSGGTRDYTSGGTRDYTSGGTRDYTSGGIRDYTSGGTRDYTSGGTRGGNVLMPIQP
jgi:hypothetical protein